jgi:predicted GNAT family acetyltransferase
MGLLDRLRAPQPPEFRDDAEAGRLEIRTDGRRAGYMAYARKPGEITLTHTEIEPEFEGRGLGGQLIREALARAREEGAAVIPVCPFVREYLQRHESERDLVPAERRAEFGLSG